MEKKRESEFEIDGITYRTIGENYEVEVRRADKEAMSLTIPIGVTYEGKRYYVTRIGDWAFAGRSDLASITLPENIMSIGDGAFDGCSKLSEINGFEYIRRVGKSAFKNCWSLKKLIISGNIELGDNCFQAAGLESISITHDGYDCQIGKSIFSDCKELSTIELNDFSIVTSSMFEGCTSLHKVICVNSAYNDFINVSENAFKNCNQLTKIEINCRIHFERGSLYNCPAVVESTSSDISYSPHTWSLPDEKVSQIPEHITSCNIDASHYKYVVFHGNLTHLSGSISMKETQYSINNFIENVQIDTSFNPQRYPQHFIFRAPKPNEKPACGRLIELTMHDEYNLWSAPVTINSDYVAFIYPIPMKCYETEEHQGCRIQLLGHDPQDAKELSRKEIAWPCIDVWESYDLVLNKLKSAGWQCK